MDFSKGHYKDIILSIDEENTKCADCDKENPSKVSVNNGIVLCEGCALQHLDLGTNVSYIRDLSGDFDEYLLNYFTLGGNSKFKRFLKEENIDPNLPIKTKYLTKACQFYRINLKKKVQGEKLLEKNYDNPNEIIENMEIYFPEFEDYVMKNDTSKSHPSNQNVEKAKKIIGNIGSNLFSFGKKLYSNVKQGANYVAVKAKPATNQIKKGAVFMGHKAGDAYSSLKNKIVALNKGKIKDNENNNINNNNNEINNEQNNIENNNNLINDNNINNNENNGPGILLNHPISGEQSPEGNGGQ